MADAQIVFNAAEDYERFMGRWSRAIGEQFLDWVAPAKKARWLDVGCGTGAFCELIIARCAPASVNGIDPSPEQVAYAKKSVPRADFRVAGADALPFDDRTFDIVVSALVLHFLPDRAQAVREMRRVARPGGIVAGYTWRRTASATDAPYGPMKRGFEAIGATFMSSPLVPEADLPGLAATIGACGLSNVELRTFDATLGYQDFADYWDTMAIPFTPTGRSMAALDDKGRAALRAHMQKALPVAADGAIRYSATAVAFKATA